MIGGAVRPSTVMDNTEFNAVVLSTANGLAFGADEREVAEGLVGRFGSEQAFLLFYAAKTYNALPEPEWTPADEADAERGRYVDPEVEGA